MLTVGFPATAFGTNCYVLAPSAGEEAVIVDPGIDIVARLEEVLATHRLKPVAVLLTHGHVDHTFSVTPVSGAHGVPAYIHPDDRELLVDPAKGLSMEGQIVFGAHGGPAEWQEPGNVRLLTDGTVLQLAGLSLTVVHAPGHTRGSVMFTLPPSGDEGPVCIAGDVLFCGSIGRTDLPGGDHGVMEATLRDKVLALHDEMRVLPGHGPETSIGVERVTNPYLISVSGENPYGPDSVV